MLIKDNKQHKRALLAIFASCSTVRKFELDHANNTAFIATFQNNGFRHDNMTQFLAVLWAEHHGTINVPLGGKYYARVKPAIDGKYAAFELILSSYDKRQDSCAHIEHYNATGGYWYTSQYDLPQAGQKALNRALFTSLRAIVSAFNRALYLR